MAAMSKRARSLSPSRSPQQSAAEDDSNSPVLGNAFPPPSREYHPPTPEEEEDGEDLIGDGMEDDYRPMGALDAYEADGLDEHEYDEMDVGTRAAADAALDARDQREQRTRMPKALLTSDDDDGSERSLRRRRRRRDAEPAQTYDDPEQAAAAGLEDFLEDDGVHINLEDYQCSLSDWIASQPVSEEVKKRFRRFLQDHGRDVVSGTGSYAQRVRRMCASNSESLEVNYHHLSHAVPILAIRVADAPREMLKLLDEAAMDSAPPRSCAHARSLFPHRTESFLLSGNSCANHVPRLRFNPSDRPCPYHRPANRGPHSRPAAGACRLPR